MPRSKALPEYLFPDLLWTYHAQSRYDDAGAFDEAVREYNAEFDGEWKPAARDLPVRAVRVSYEGVSSPDAPEYEPLSVTLTADDAAGFTNLELFLKLHNAVVGHLADVDHCFFEGLSLVDGGEVPHYELMQGS